MLITPNIFTQESLYQRRKEALYGKQRCKQKQSQDKARKREKQKRNTTEKIGEEMENRTAYKFDSKYLGQAFMGELVEMGYSMCPFTIEGCNYIIDNFKTESKSVGFNQNNGEAKTTFTLELQWNGALEYAKNKINPKPIENEYWITRRGLSKVIGKSSLLSYDLECIDIEDDYRTNQAPYSYFERKATPEEIKKALIKEAKRRGFPCEKWNFPGYKRNFSNPRLLDNHKWKYFEKTDLLSNNGGTVYKQGKWAKPIEQPIKFFGWDVEDTDTNDVIEIFPEDLNGFKTKESMLRYFQHLLQEINTRKKGVTLEELLKQTDQLIQSLWVNKTGQEK